MRNVDPDAERAHQAADDWLDDALTQSFPASDPLPMFHGDSEVSAPSGDDGLEGKPSGCVPATFIVQCGPVLPRFGEVRSMLRKIADCLD